MWLTSPQHNQHSYIFVSTIKSACCTVGLNCNRNITYGSGQNPDVQHCKAIILQLRGKNPDVVISFKYDLTKKTKQNKKKQICSDCPRNQTSAASQIEDLVCSKSRRDSFLTIKVSSFKTVLCWDDYFSFCMLWTSWFLSQILLSL